MKRNAPTAGGRTLQMQAHRESAPLPRPSMALGPRRPDLDRLDAIIKASPVAQARSIAADTWLDGMRARDAPADQQRPPQTAAPREPVQRVKIRKHWSRPSPWRRRRHGGYITHSTPRTRRNFEVATIGALNELLRPHLRFRRRERHAAQQILDELGDQRFATAMRLYYEIQRHLGAGARPALVTSHGFHAAANMATVESDSEGEDVLTDTTDAARRLRGHNQKKRGNGSQNFLSMSVTARYRPANTKVYRQDTARVRKTWHSGGRQGDFETNVRSRNVDFIENDLGRTIDEHVDNDGQHDSEIAAAADPQLTSLIGRAIESLKATMAKTEGGFVVLSFTLNVDSFPYAMCERHCRYAMATISAEFGTLARSIKLTQSSGGRLSGRFKAILKVTSREPYTDENPATTVFRTQTAGKTQPPLKVRGNTMVEVMPSELDGIKGRPETTEERRNGQTRMIDSSDDEDDIKRKFNRVVFD